VAAVELSARARRDLRRLPRGYLAAVANSLRGLVDDPLAGKPLGGDLAGLRSLRVGMYRIVYRFDDRSQVLQVVWVRHRGEAYR